MNTDLQNYLSNRDLVELMSLSQRSLACKNENDLNQLILDLKNLFYFENTLYAQGNIREFLQDNHQSEKIFDICNISYPAEFIKLYFGRRLYSADAALLEFITNLSPVNWHRIEKKCGGKYPVSSMASDFNMFDGWFHGNLDLDHMTCTTFFFVGPVIEDSIRIPKILEYIVPFYLEAYKRIRNKKEYFFQKLTSKEVEVLSWIKDGKSSWEISKILKCSKRTVDFHFGNIKQKLNAVSRAQAVAIGLHNGYITF